MRNTLLKYITIIVLFSISTACFSQHRPYKKYDNEKFVITLGVFNGGGGLVGADLEYFVTPHLGVTAGAGYISYGFGLNYHLSSGGSRSSYFNLSYFQQGVGDSFYKSYIGPSLVWRAKKILQIQAGIAYLLDTGADYEGTVFPMFFVGSVGVYFPF